MFRLFYLLIPLAFAIVVVALFERRRIDRVLHPGTAPTTNLPTEGEQAQRTSA